MRMLKPNRTAVMRELKDYFFITLRDFYHSCRRGAFIIIVKDNTVFEYKFLPELRKHKLRPAFLMLMCK